MKKVTWSVSKVIPRVCRKQRRSCLSLRLAWWSRIRASEVLWLGLWCWYWWYHVIQENERTKDLIIEQRFHRAIIGQKGEKIKEVRDKFPEVSWKPLVVLSALDLFTYLILFVLGYHQFSWPSSEKWHCSASRSTKWGWKMCKIHAEDSGWNGNSPTDLMFCYSCFES